MGVWEQNRVMPAGIILLGIVALFRGIASAQAGAEKRCIPPTGQIVSVQGVIEVRRAEGWQRAALNEFLCGGDMVRTLIHSRTIIFLPAQQTTLQLDQSTTITLPDTAPSAAPSWLDLLEGAGHFLSRTPRAFKIKTPFVNAYIEGTEFVVRVEGDQTLISVLNGTVLASNEAGSLKLQSGQAAIAKAHQAPLPVLIARPWDAVQWALYYPPIIDYRSAAAESAPAVQAALDLYRQGRLLDAFASLDRVPPPLRDGRYFDIRAGLLLSVGRVDEARADIEQALRLRPGDGTAIALQSLIAVVQNDKEQALSLAKQAVSAEPRSPVPQIALSYAYQARFDIEQAFDSVREATRLAPDNALAWARLSELSLSKGELDEALAAAKKAAALEPALARTQTVLGFADLTEINLDDAKAAFHRAIALDPADPLPRLGLGLTQIRKGDLDKGTQDIEIAATLDPNNSLVRSYLGKAYYEQKRSGLAGTELQIAKALDPKDPTPWFYDAIRKQTENRPVEALQDLQKSIELNDNRAVYRSRLLLDQDVAARSVNLARTYDDLGFQQRARVEAWKSVTADLSSFSAHRFLADSYSTLQRHEIARVSELLQSQLLQPINITPLQPELAVTNLAILQGTGPSSLSFYEFNPLFTRNGVALQTNALFGNNATVADDFVVSGIYGPFSGSLGQFHYHTNGFRPNNDLQHDIYNAFGQVRVAPKLSLQVELRRSEQEAGDVDITLNALDPTFRQRLNQDSARIGAHYELTPRQDLLASAIYANSKTITDQLVFDGTAKLNLTNPVDGYSGELQHLYRGERYKTIAGIGHVKLRDRTTIVLGPALGTEGETPLGDTTTDREATNGYVYAPIALGSDATVTLGASYDSFHTPELDKHQVNPKFGLIWDVLPSTTLRVAAFRVLKRFFVTNQTLEPTQLAGFNQFFDDLDGTDSTRYGFGLDQRFSQNLFGGFEASRRELTRTYSDRIAEEQDERFYRAYLHWAPHSRLALAAEYQFEEFERGKVLDNGQRVFRGLPQLRTHYVPLKISYYHPAGFFAKLGATYVHQEVEKLDLSMPNDRFWVVDASVGWRLPKRYGLVSFDARNLFDEEFSYQNSFNEGKQQLPRFEPSRAVFARVNLWFY